MKYDDLSENEGLSAETRIKHLEREASFVRDHVSSSAIYQAITLACSMAAIALSLIAIFKK